MAAKIGKGYKTTRTGLAAMMAGDDALVTPGRDWNANVIGSALHGSSSPPLHEGFSALLIMHGLTAKWCINYWMLENREGARAHVSAKEDFDEWQAAVKSIDSRTVK